MRTVEFSVVDSAMFEVGDVVTIDDSSGYVSSGYYRIEAINGAVIKAVFDEFHDIDWFREAVRQAVEISGIKGVNYYPDNKLPSRLISMESRQVYTQPATRINRGRN